MSNQRAIEDHVGIDAEVAAFMMKSKTRQARVAMDLLHLAVARPEPGAMGLLSAAVQDCKRAMAGAA